MPSLPAFVDSLGHGIYVIDTGFQRPRFDASYLVVEGGRAAFVDTGTNHAVPRLLGALEALGLSREAVVLVIPTHVHLDHAGGAGLLMQALPAAQLVVHPRGAGHLVEPARLMAGARAVYGDAEVERSYGELVAVPADRVVQTRDGMTLELAGRPLRFLDTPGHARHHHCIWDEASRGFFTGDTFGVSYEELSTPRGRWALLATPPVQFEPEALRGSIERLLTFAPACMYLTHYGRVAAVRRLATLLLAELEETVAFASGVAPGPEREAELQDGLAQIHWRSLQREGSTLALDEVRERLALDIELNAKGIGIWLDRRTRAGARSNA
jgi:glyoxylase-like metal-dependent hydrolase (beta-lactamase superfamily II)